MLSWGKTGLVDLGAWLSNVATSVLLVFVNKVLLSASGYGFTFATTLSAFHFLASTLSIWAAQAAGIATSALLPWQERLKYGAVGAASVASLNMSLLVNTVGCYQVAKLMIIPFVCTIEWLWLGCRVTRSSMICIAAVVFGVATITVNDVTAHTFGLFLAAVSVATSGLQQVMCGSLQKHFKLSSHELLANTAPVQGVLLLLLGPIVDKVVTGAELQDYHLSSDVAIMLFFSCTIAVAVNLSQFMCLGRFTALTFQVLGHSKTIIVLLGGWSLMNDTISHRQFWGILVAISGMVGYGIDKIGRIPCK